MKVVLVFMDCFKEVTRCSKEVVRVFQGRFKKVSRAFQTIFKGVTWNFQGCIQSVSKVFQKCFKSVSKSVSKVFQQNVQGVSRSLMLHGTHRSYLSRRRACFISTWMCDHLNVILQIITMSVNQVWALQCQYLAGS